MSDERRPLPEPMEDLPSRDSIQREVLRSNTAVAVVLGIVLGLTLAVVLSGVRATRNQQRAEQAEAESTERLWNSYIAQANALRLTATSGRRANALQVISNAAAIRPSLVLRTEAVATLALLDLERDSQPTPLPPSTDSTEMDTQLERFSYGNTEGIITIASVKDGAKLLQLEARDAGPGLKMTVSSTGFSPDGKYLCARFAGGALAAWDLTTRERILTAGLHATNQIIAGMSYSPDSERLMFSDPDREKQITMFDLKKREIIATGIRVGARTFRFRPGTSQLGLVTDNQVDLMDYPQGTVRKTFDHLARVFLLAWSPNGTQLVVGCEDGDIYLWDVERGTHRLLRGHSEPCMRLGFSPDGKLLYTGSRDGSTRLWNAENGQLILVTEHSVAHTFSPDGKRMGYWQLSKALGTWKVNRSDCYTALPCPKEDGAFVSLDLSADGRWCVATQTKGIRAWDLASENYEAFFPVAGLQSTRIAPDGKSFFVCRSNRLERWPLTDAAGHGGPLAFGEAQVIPLPDHLGARNIAVSADGSTAAVELTDTRFVAIDLKGERAPVIFPEKWRGANAKSSGSHTGPGRFAISPDGRWICTGFWFGSKDNPRVWDARTGQIVASPEMGTSIVTFSPDGLWLGLAGVAEFQIYSTSDWKCAAKIKRDESSFTHGAMTFLRDGQIALTRTRQTIQLRDAFSDEKFFDFIAPVPQSVASLRVSLDGQVLVTGSARDVIQVWRLDRLRQHLAAMKLDWGHPDVSTDNSTQERFTFWPNTNAILLLGLSGFVVVTVLSLLTLKRHRAAMERFFDAETKAAQRNRELEVAKVELMHSQKMQALGTLAAGIAHDFNNLLSVIRMSNKLIGREAKANPEIQENVADIEQAVLQGKGVVGSMLGYARSDGDADQATDVCAVVENAVSLLSKEFLSGITLTLELDRPAPLVHIGRGRLEQVLLNLIVNASEAMQGKGRLKIAVHARSALPVKPFALRPNSTSHFVEMTVTDSGPGVPLEIQSRVFDPFFTTKRSGAKAGTGLGLSLVYSIAEQEGMGLSVESLLGIGASFTLVIPVRQMHSSQSTITS